MYSLGCNPTVAGNCNAAKLAAYLQYRYWLQGNVTSVLGPADGAFLTACYQHEESCADVDWYGIAIGGATANSTHYGWRDAGVAPSASRAVDVVWPGDGTCAPQGVRHGSC